MGAKAGAERYEQLRRLYENLLASPTFQSASSKAKDAVETGFEQAKDKASDGVSKVSGAVKERRSGNGESEPANLSVAPPPAH